MAETVLSISLKEYKKEIDELKGALLGLEKESKEYGVILTEIREKEAKLKEVMSDVKKTADASSDTMNGLKQKLKELKQEIGNEKLGSDKFNELSKSIMETTDKLKDLEAQQGTYSRNVGNYESATASLKSQLKELTQQMAEMLASGVSPTDKSFVELAKKAGDMKDAMDDARSSISHFANDTKSLATVVDLAKTGAAAYGAFKGTLSLFGIENENVNKSLETMVAITTTLNSLQTLQTAMIDRSSITYRLYHSVIESLGLSKTKLNTATATEATTTTASTATIKAHTGAMVADTAATGAATVATNIFKKALISTGIGAVVVLVGTLIAHLGDLVDGIKSVCSWVGKATGLIKDNTEAEKRQAEAAKRDKENQEALARTEQDLATKNAELSATFQTLKARWDQLDTVEEKRKFVERYKNEMSALGVEINNVNDAENFFSTEGAMNFARSIEIRAKLAIAQQKLMQKIQQIQKSEAEDALTPGYLYSEKNLILAEITDLYKELEALQTKYQSKQQTKTTKPTKTTSGKDNKEDVSGEMEKFERSLDEQIAAINYAYDLLEARGEATVKDEIEKVSSIYIVTNNMIQREIEDRQKQLENTKITAEQRKQIQDELYELEQKRIDVEREYTIESERLKLNARKETLDEIKKLTADAIQSENESFKSSSIVSIYTEMLKDAEPEVASSIVRMLSVSDEDKEQIIDNIALLNSDKEEVIYQYYMQEEDAEYQHQQNLLQIQKDALVQMGIEFGEDSNEYLTQKQLVYDQEEQIARKHFENLEKMENQHAKSTKKNNKLTKDNYIDMARGIGSIMDSVASMMEDDIRNKEENGEITKEEAEKQFETVKSLQIVAATIDMFSGAVQAYATAQSLGPIAGPIVGSINAAAVTAMGIANINQIKSQKFGSSSTSGASTPAQATREAVNIDFSGVSVNPLLDEQADINRMTTLSETQPSEQRVYILQSDIADSQRQVEVRQSNTTF